ncbi:hypothetical protein BJ322DRAFT_1014891 [Thelephora terrestris]|uniref:Uncharacterized protein n=1 Tax=Thelephora terrestris TaxID=56493 RepID=A0A9P6H435_9AGAM|nr:hypothetical protein BJ322DRAFT_1014891 [Thelephora terrestris]
MPPPSNHEAFHLSLLPNIYFVKELPAFTERRLSDTTLSLPNGQAFFSITRTPEECSVVGEMTDDPHFQSLSEGFRLWRCTKIAGPLEFGKPPPPAAVWDMLPYFE